MGSLSYLCFMESIKHSASTGQKALCVLVFSNSTNGLDGGCSTVSNLGCQEPECRLCFREASVHIPLAESHTDSLR